MWCLATMKKSQVRKGPWALMEAGCYGYITNQTSTENVSVSFAKYWANKDWSKFKEKKLQ